jgi:uncharacterized repeat protein (TIGR04138 family)
MMAPVTINCDLACIGCEYNLRGLATDGKCPECGRPIRETLETVPSGEIPELDDLIFEVRRRRYEPVAQVAQCSIDAVMIVHDALRYASFVAQRNSMKVVQRPINARDVCDALREHALFYFNDQAEAKELLAEWGVKTSLDVGKVIFAMVEVGWLVAHAGDSVDQFAGLFTLDTLFDPPC